VTKGMMAGCWSLGPPVAHRRRKRPRPPNVVGREIHLGAPAALGQKGRILLGPGLGARQGRDGGSAVACRHRDLLVADDDVALAVEGGVLAGADDDRGAGELEDGGAVELRASGHVFAAVDGGVREVGAERHGAPAEQRPVERRVAARGPRRGGRRGRGDTALDAVGVDLDAGLGQTSALAVDALVAVVELLGQAVDGRAR
jgi:hypothetical protein